MTLDALRPLLPLWGLPEVADLRLLHVSENATYRAEHEGAAIILRLHRAGYHSEAEIRSELAWIDALRVARVTPTVEPLVPADGDAVRTVRVDGEARRLVAFAEIAGREPDPGDDLTAWFAELGEITARLQSHARGWRPPPGFTRKRWDVETILGPRPHWGDWRDAPGLDAEGREVLGRLAADLAARLGAYGTGAAQFGLVHADLRLANLLIADGVIWAIDFDDCGFGWWMYDFAAAVSFIEDDPRVPELARLWAGGYARVLPLAREDVAALPVMVMLRRLLLTAWLGVRADSDTARALGGASFTSGTVALAERFLRRGPAGFWAE